ncbi:hypothetical protein ASPBRDRAFT_28619 [Aspergillus brasiliensis CBS 101740]|uniref:Uncharacterized protein n=1 Tax=Aspergillus brasiliensis (strain CBS 101740 / IMI 381727 / IBT 21946) TaxID=767769 RepID=A0A1L9UNP0_ASPBC|nr:hypothetical protein ASPBRDRAFT_28619 [Aspergillus brasiliensis CBS 101740]
MVCATSTMKISKLIAQYDPFPTASRLNKRTMNPRRTMGRQAPPSGSPSQNWHFSRNAGVAMAGQFPTTSHGVVGFIQKKTIRGYFFRFVPFMSASTYGSIRGVAWRNISMQFKTGLMHGVDIPSGLGKFDSQAVIIDSTNLAKAQT